MDLSLGVNKKLVPKKIPNQTYADRQHLGRISRNHVAAEMGVQMESLTKGDSKHRRTQPNVCRNVENQVLQNECRKERHQQKAPGALCPSTSLGVEYKDPVCEKIEDHGCGDRNNIGRNSAPANCVSCQ